LISCTSAIARLDGLSTIESLERERDEGFLPILGEAKAAMQSFMGGSNSGSGGGEAPTPAPKPTSQQQEQSANDVGVQEYDWIDEGGHDPVEAFSDYDMLTTVASLEDCKKQCVAGVLGCKDRCGSPSSLEREHFLLHAASLEQGATTLEREDGFFGDAKAAVQSFFGGGDNRAPAPAPTPTLNSGIAPATDPPTAKECHIMGYSLAKRTCWLYHNVYQLSYKPSDSGATYYTKQKKKDPWSIKWNKHIAPDCIGPEVLEDAGKFEGDAMSCKLKAIENIKANYAVWGGEKAKNVCKLCRVSQEIRTNYMDDPGAVSFYKKNVKATPTAVVNQPTTAPPSTSSAAMEMCRGQNCTHGAHHRNQWYEETTPTKAKLHLFAEEGNPELHETCCDSSPFCCGGICQPTDAMCKGDFPKEERLDPWEDKQEEPEEPAKKEPTEEDTQRETKDKGNEWVETRYNKAIFDIQSKAALPSNKPTSGDKSVKQTKDGRLQHPAYMERERDGLWDSLGDASKAEKVHAGGKIGDVVNSALGNQQLERMLTQHKQQHKAPTTSSVVELLSAAQADGALQAARAFEKEASHWH